MTTKKSKTKELQCIQPNLTEINTWAIQKNDLFDLTIDNLEEVYNGIKNDLEIRILDKLLDSDTLLLENINNVINEFSKGNFIRDNKLEKVIIYIKSLVRYEVLEFLTPKINEMIYHAIKIDLNINSILKTFTNMGYSNFSTEIDSKYYVDNAYKFHISDFKYYINNYHKFRVDVLKSFKESLCIKRNISILIKYNISDLNSNNCTKSTEFTYFVPDELLGKINNMLKSKYQILDKLVDQYVNILIEIKNIPRKIRKIKSKLILEFLSKSKEGKLILSYIETLNKDLCFPKE